MKKNLKNKKSLNIAMLGHKRIPSREGGIEIVVEELATRMVTLGHKVTCYNRSGHHVSGKDFDGGKRKAYKGVRLKSVLTLDSPYLDFASNQCYNSPMIIKSPKSSVFNFLDWLGDISYELYKRYLIGNELHSKIDEIAELAIENEKILKTKTTMRNRIRNGCKNILKQGFPEAVYSAFMATLIFNDENFKTCMEILKRQDIWDDELEESFQKMNNNVFKIRRE